VGDHIGLSIGSTDRDRLTTVFNALADGGQVGMPLTDQPWRTAGWLTDRFGINWNVAIEKGWLGLHEATRQGARGRSPENL